MNTNIYFHRELLETFAYQIHPVFAAEVRSKYKQNRALGISLEDIPAVSETSALFTRKKGSGNMFSKLVVTDVERQDHDPWAYPIEETDEAINVIYITSAIMRNGGGCSVGSIEHRDKLLYCASKPNVLGHIFVLDSPGGCVDAIYDYIEGIEAVKAAGQPCIGIITGECASLCTRVSAHLDEVYYSYEKYKFGCIGTMAIMDLMPHGAVNPTTGETHVELYAENSPKKNYIFREAAKGNYAPMQEYINKCNEEFLSDMRTLRPNCKEEYLTGELYDCSMMEGIFLDGKKSFDECITRIIELRGSTPVTIVEPNANGATGSEGSSATSQSTADGASNNQLQNPKQMNLPLLEALLGFTLKSELGVNAEGASVEGSFLNSDILASIENALSQKDAALDALKQTHQTAIEEHQTALDALNQSHQTAIEELNQSHQTEITNLNQSHQTAIEELNKSHKDEIDALNQSHQTTVDDLNNTIAERDATITELSAQSTSAQNPDPSTAQNGEGDGNPKTPESACASKAGMSLKERREAQSQRDAQLGIK